jgi:hypothetical protein
LTQDFSTTRRLEKKDEWLPDFRRSIKDLRTFTTEKTWEIRAASQIFFACWGSWARIVRAVRQPNPLHLSECGRNEQVNEQQG